MATAFFGGGGGGDGGAASPLSGASPAHEQPPKVHVVASPAGFFSAAASQPPSQFERISSPLREMEASTGSAAVRSSSHTAVDDPEEDDAPDGLLPPPFPNIAEATGSSLPPEPAPLDTDDDDGDDNNDADGGSGVDAGTVLTNPPSLRTISRPAAIHAPPSGALGGTEGGAIPGGPVPPTPSVLAGFPTPVAPADTAGDWDDAPPAAVDPSAVGVWPNSVPPTAGGGVDAATAAASAAAGSEPPVPPSVRAPPVAAPPTAAVPPRTPSTSASARKVGGAADEPGSPNELEEWQGRAAWQAEGDYAWPDPRWQDGGGDGDGGGGGGRPGARFRGAPGSPASALLPEVKRHEQDVMNRLSGLEQKLKALLQSPSNAVDRRAGVEEGTPTSPLPMDVVALVAHAQASAGTPTPVDGVSSPHAHSLPTAVALDALGKLVQRLQAATGTILAGTGPPDGGHVRTAMVEVTPGDVRAMHALVRTVHDSHRAFMAEESPVEAETGIRQLASTHPDIFDDGTQSFVLSVVSPKGRSSYRGSISSTASGTPLSPPVIASGLGSSGGGGAAAGSGGLTPPWRLPVVRHPLERLSAWDFDVLHLHATVCPDVHPAPSDTQAWTLVTVAGACITAIASHFALPLESQLLHAFLNDLAANYQANPYHNALHGADVCHGCYSMLVAGGLSAAAPPHAAVALLIAAAGHDVGHMARSNQFLVATSHSLAITYNDKSPLENMHAATVSTLLRRPGNNVLSCFSDAHQTAMRQLLVSTILSTDNAHHLTLLARLDGRLGSVEDGTMPLRMHECGDPDTTLVCQTVLHAVDVSNPAKTWDVYRQWTARILEEFFAEGDEVRSLGMEVPRMNNRHEPLPLPKMQAGFIHGVCMPLYTSLMRLPVVNVSAAHANLVQNLKEWERRLRSST